MQAQPWSGKTMQEIRYYPVLESTNTFAKEAVKKGEISSGTVLVAKMQTRGRGRKERSWLSHRGSLTFSLIWRCENYEQLPLLAFAVSLWTARALMPYTKEIRVKWPNDLYFGLGKLGGILGESCRVGQELLVIMGIGINVNGEAPRDLEVEAVSLQQAIGKEICKQEVLQLILSSLDEGFASFGGELWELQSLIKEQGCFLHRWVTLEGSSSFSAYVYGVTRNGNLLCYTKEGRRIKANPSTTSLRLALEL